jgi:hypothetical protein
MNTLFEIHETQPRRGLTDEFVHSKLVAGRRYGDGHGLYLQVTDASVRSWVFRYERGGREKMMGLGPLHTIDLTTARERARKARQQLLDGIDPLDARPTHYRHRRFRPSSFRLF